ncbi:MAG: PQQ-binding-like beta-propeller repeat protein [Candidatus Poseidoniaceae archaeon]|nr:PQQ-binding-like beta-propeller repeat protein [Candidatus Poseidoniaceae archaeon]
MFRRLMALLFASLFLVPAILAEAPSTPWEETHSFSWEYNFETGFISTSPLFTGEQLLVRTSGHAEPSVTAFDLSGAKIWEHTNPESTNNDMSPLLHVPAGQGQCGSWPEMVLVGWTSGLVEALNPSDGELLWSTQSEVVGWGVTGELALDGAFVMIPTRQGIGQYCLADGQQQWWTETGLGWRNGVAVDETGYFMGDEAGQLWHINRTGAATSHALQLGKIRHAPLFTDAGILIHAQADSGSTIGIFNSTNATLTQQFPAGFSPAIPVLQGEYIVTGDSSNMRMLHCSSVCVVLDEIPFHTNGEIGWFDNGQIFAPSNLPDSNWGFFTFDDENNLTYSSIEVGLHGYGTASPIQFSDGVTTFTAFGNDQAILRVYSNFEENTTLSTSNLDLGAQLLLFGMFVLLGFSSAFLLNGKREWFLRTSSLFALVLVVLLLPDLSSQWSKSFDEQFSEPASPEEWNEQWPDAWLGTQIIIFEIDGKEYSAGGFVGHTDVLSLTQVACEALDFELSGESTELGWYIDSINGIEGKGWEFSVDGSKGIISVDQSMVFSTSIVRWTPV